MSELYLCQKCGGTYLLDEMEKEGTCSRCGLRLIPACEWCGRPENQCHCGKDEILLDKE